MRGGLKVTHTGVILQNEIANEFGHEPPEFGPTQVHQAEAPRSSAKMEN